MKNKLADMLYECNLEPEEADEKAEKFMKEMYASLMEALDKQNFLMGFDYNLASDVIRRGCGQ